MSLLEELLDDGDWSVWEEVANWCTVLSEILKKLALDSIWLVLLAVVYNVSVKSAMLEKLSSDKDYRVSKFASCATQSIQSSSVSKQCEV